MMFLYSSGYRCYRVSISDCRCCGARVCKKISSWFIYVAAGGSIDYRMLRKEDLSGQEEESYQRQMNKDKIQIRRRERETMFNHKRSNFIPTHFVTLEKMESADGQQRQQANEKSSKGFYKIVDGSIYILDQRYIEQIIQANHYDFPNDIQVHTQLITSDSTLGLICGTVGLRKLLNHTRNIQDIIDGGLVDIIIELMSYAQSKQVQFEATWCIANIAAGTTQQSKILIDGGVVPILLDFIQQNNSGIVQQAIWAIGNLSVDCTQFRNILLESGVGDAISNLLTKEDLGEQFRIECCWTLANLCRGDPLPDFDLVKNSLSVICSMVSMGCIKSIEILVDCCWALSYHYTGRNDRGRDALNFNLLQRIVPIGLYTERSRVVLPIMRILGGLSLGSIEYTQHIIEKGGLDLLEKCIQHDQKMIRREAAYILSNLTATPDLPQIEHILGRDTIMIKMTEMFVHDQEEVRREIAYFFSNMCYGGKELDLVKVFAELQITSCYVELLKSDNHKAILEGLQSLNHILRLGQAKKSSYKLNILAEQLIHNGGIHIIEGLQQNDEDRIYIGAHSILVSYFSLCDPLGPLEDVDGTIDESTYSDEQQRQQGQVL